LQELTSIFEDKKHAYDTASAGMESNMAKLEQARFKLTSFMVISTDCIGSCKSKYHMNMATTTPLYLS
jgi:hypothetical protein